MLRYLASRGARALITIFLVLSFAFVILRLSGDPALLILSPDAPPEALEAFRQGWGLDAPLWKQYLGYFVNILEGNLGQSMRDGRPAIDLVLERIPATLAITLPAFALKLLIGIPAVMLGVFIMGAVGVWFAVRCVLGVIYLARGEAYPRPMNWLI